MIANIHPIQSLIILTFLLVSIKALYDISCGKQNITGCTECPTGSNNFTIVNIDTSLYTCADKSNCLQVNNSKQCLRCSIGFTLINANCHSIIQNCIKYTVDAVSVVTCDQCAYEFMDKSAGCAVTNKTYCQIFNNQTGMCELCNATGYFMDQSRKFCFKPIPNCHIHSFDGCAQCQQQYIPNPANKSECILSVSIEYQIQTTQISHTTQLPQTKITTLCLQNNFYQNPFNSSECIAMTSQVTVDNCKQFNPINSSCFQCIEGFYLAQSVCNDCRATISHCLTCSYDCSTSECQPNCTICEPAHYTFLSQGQYICRSCSTYGCAKCESDQNSAIVCTECQRGKTLFNSTCYSCPEGFELSLITLECTACPLNCASCSNNVCKWCKQTYARDSSNICVLNSTLLKSITSGVTIYELLSKSFPNQQQLIYNNEVDLMSSCKQQGTRFTCICSSNSSSTVSSMCYSLTEAKKFDFSKVFTTAITPEVFLANSETLRLMAQLPAFDSLNFNIEFTATTQIFFSQNKMASLLQIYAQVERRRKSTAESALSGRLLNVQTTFSLQQLFRMAEFSFKQTLSRSQTTVIYGNGYYMKHYPATSDVLDEDQFVKAINRNTSHSLFVFVWFDNLNSSQSLTGTIYAFSPSASYNLTLEIQQITYPATTFSYQLYENDLKSTSPVSKASTNSLSFAVQTSTATARNDYNVKYTQTTALDASSLFNNQRIQFIFYQSAFIYVLIFLVAYLFLIPCCALLDFMSPKRAQHRKRVQSQDMTLNQGKPSTSEDASSAQTTIIQINYKDFFPIYNICNTPRPKRILKLCLFLLNMQHGITFLTLIYFGLGAGHPVVAVVIGIPAYFCTIIMGYICGVLTIVIPGWFKYLINLFVLGYWILWVALMPRFSHEYQPYVIIFAVVFFAIDLTIDCLEMFMVHFSIIKTNKQSIMFECLAAWLSKRGYFEYDQLAHQIQDNDN